MSLFIAAYALRLSDMALWQKLAHPTGSIGIAFGGTVLERYIKRKREGRRQMKETFRSPQIIPSNYLKIEHTLGFRIV